MAVIGTGCSALQFIPEIAGRRRRGDRVPAHPTVDRADARLPRRRRRRACTWLFGHVPTYSELNRFYDLLEDGRRRAGERSASIRTGSRRRRVGRARSARSARRCCREYYREQFGDRPDLLEKVHARLPARRQADRCATTASGRATLKRDNVQLVTDAIGEIDDRRHRDGRRHASRRRRDHLRHGLPGLELPDADDGRSGATAPTCTSSGPATRGPTSACTVPGFPNLFCLYGPNTNIVINGSIIYFSECGVRYIMGLLKHGARPAAPTPIEVKRGRPRRVQRARSTPRTARWRGAAAPSTAGTRTRSGRIAQNWPFTLLEYWQRTKAPDPADFTVA